MKKNELMKVKELSKKEEKNINGGGVLAWAVGVVAGIIYLGGDKPNANIYSPSRK